MENGNARLAEARSPHLNVEDAGPALVRNSQLLDIITCLFRAAGHEKAKTMSTERLVSNNINVLTKPQRKTLPLFREDQKRTARAVDTGMMSYGCCVDYLSGGFAALTALPADPATVGTPKDKTIMGKIRNWLLMPFDPGMMAKPPTDADTDAEEDADAEEEVSDEEGEERGD